MFKYVAITLVAFIAGIAATFAAIGYADQHPDSVLAQYVNKVRASLVGEATRAGAEVACLAPADPIPCQETEETLPPRIQIEQPAAASSTNRLPGAIVINEEEEFPRTGAISATEPEPCAVPEQARKIMLSLRRVENTPNIGVEECEPVAPFMPYCEDGEPVGAVMPYAEESRNEKAAGSFLAFWMGFFSKPDPTGANGPEENSAPPLGQTPECKEDPAAHLQYPGLPFSGFTQSKKPSPRGNTKSKVAPFEEELQEAFPAPKTTPDLKNLLKKDGTLGDPKLHSHIDTTECRPSDFGFDNLGLRPF